LRILFIIPYPPGRAPSQRFRFEQYLDLLPVHGHEYKLAPFLDEATWAILYQPGQTGRKVIGILTGFWRRLLLLLTVPSYDYVFVHREAAPIGPPIIEWIITKVLRKRVVYDFDDAIWMADPAADRGFLGKLKWQQKVSSICRWSYKVSCGNAYLRDYAQQFNSLGALINPTTLDTDHLHNQVRNQEELSAGRVVIGWTGTHTTLRHLDLIWPALQQLEAEGHNFEFIVIANQPPEHITLKSMRFMPWRKGTEIADLLQFHFGLMPLVDDPWARGKCAFKALQYMALGMPALVSPVGMNTEVVAEGENGYICAATEQWYTAIRELLINESARVRLGAAARKTIVERYSVRSNTANFLDLFSGVNY
jgi:glycosyltransferase involved in cell wall biosynthesis